MHYDSEGIGDAPVLVVVLDRHDWVVLWWWFQVPFVGSLPLFLGATSTCCAPWAWDC